MVIHAWVQGRLAVCIAPACKASIPCKGSGRSRPGLSADGPSALLRLSRKRRVCCCSLGAPILIALGRVHCADPVPTALACSAAAPVRCRGVARAFDRGKLDFLGKAYHSLFGSSSGGTTRRLCALTSVVCDLSCACRSVAVWSRVRCRVYRFYARAVGDCSVGGVYI